MTQAELARHLSVSRQAIHALVERNVLPIGADGRIDVAAAESAIADSIHPSSKTATAIAPPLAEAEPAPQQAMSYNTAKTLREIAEAQIAQLKLRTLRGELGPRAELDRAMRTAIITAREYLRGEAPRLAMLLDDKTKAERETALVSTFDEFLHILATWESIAVEEDHAA